MRLGVDIGGTKTDVVLEHAGAVVARHRTPSGIGPDAVIGAATGAVDVVLAEAGVGFDRVESIGVGIPGGVVDGVVTHALNLGVERLDLAGELERVWGTRPAIDNDVNVAALGAWAITGKHVSSLAYLNLGTGLAAGLILDGKLWRGARGTAGELGHIGVDPAGPLDADGLPGALETFASGSGIARQWGVDDAHAREVLDAAAAGDAKALAIREGVHYGLASAIRALVLMLDVEKVVLGGGLTAYGDGVIGGARALLDEWARRSDFLDSLSIGERITVLDSEVPIAALGAADLGAAGDHVRG